ncbi:MAG TPA: AMP-binding protein [Chloroflexia bacterium]|jgi:fatty-acyl-CoA synthase|nr:AMP-binding protein [Chloroflexia bacterium]
MVALTQSYWPADDSEPIVESTVGDVLRAAAAAVPDRVALVEGRRAGTGRRSWTYAALLDQADGVARALLGRFAPGERVAVWAPNIPEWQLLRYGAALAGLTLVPINPAYRPAELGPVLEQSGAAGIFLLSEYRRVSLAEGLDAVLPQVLRLRERIFFETWPDFCATASPTERLPQVAPADPALLLYTSGTTGSPKGALLRHRGITNNGRLLAQRLGAEDGQTWINFLPLFNVGGSVISGLAAPAHRATEVLANFDPGLVLHLIETERVNMMVGPPTMFIALMEDRNFARCDLASLRAIGAGATVVPADVARRIAATFGVPCSILYGQTEASGIITQTWLDDTEADQAETIGQPLPQVEVKIIDPGTGAIVPPGTPGELCARGYQVMAGYLDLPEATAKTLDAEGWLHTGDICSMDRRGYCRVEGRRADVIIRGGQNIYPREIEQVLYTHPAVAEVAVVGIPQAKYGEVVAAFIRPAPGPAPSGKELRAFCREHLAAYKIPRHWVFVDAFPMTPSGKIQKAVLRETFIRQQIPRLAPDPPAPTPVGG